MKNPSQIPDSCNVTPKNHSNKGGGIGVVRDSSSRSLSFGRSGGVAGPKRREDAFPVPAAAADGEESADAARQLQPPPPRQRPLDSRTTARSRDASDDGEAASAATAIGPLFSRRLGTAGAKPSQLSNKYIDNELCQTSSFEGQRRPVGVLSGVRDFTSERSKSDLCHGRQWGGLRDLVYRSSIRIMVRPELRETLVIQRSASENRVSNGANGSGGGGGGGGADEVNGANGASEERKNSRKESIGLIQKSVARDNVR